MQSPPRWHARRSRDPDVRLAVADPSDGWRRPYADTDTDTDTDTNSHANTHADADADAESDSDRNPDAAPGRRRTGHQPPRRPLDRFHPAGAAAPHVGLQRDRHR